MSVNATSPPAACAVTPPICEPGGAGLLLPLTESELDLSNGLRAVIYGVVMVYFFVGVAIIADTFVASIESITSAWKKVRRNGQIRTVKVWNETVATLTLMALGSSAPEICLAVIDVFKKDFHAAELGPSTIVGSASFNLLVIVSVCICVIPSSEERFIKELPAFYITALFSLGAYMWLSFILVYHTKDMVDPWEAIVTFLFLPVLVWVSYKTDVGAFDCLLLRLGVAQEKVECFSVLAHGRRRSQSNDPEASDGAQQVAVISFVEERMSVDGLDQTSGETKQVVDVAVRCTNNRKGPVSCKYRTARINAVPDIDYESVEGELVFPPDVPEKHIPLTINIASGNKEESELLLLLEEPEGADFNPDTDGGDEMSILTMTIRTVRSQSSCMKFLGKFIDIDGFRRGVSDWKEQLVNVIYVGGSKEDQDEASKMDWAMHILALPWKLVFVAVPPPSFFGGWLCFVGSLIWIGVLSTFVSDLAELFGCVLNLGDVVTAITFVALGTSMPDLFASLSAAREDAHADASIVNVTGSNSVNVFLGLGLPWTICAIYWAFKERTPEWEACYPEEAAKLDPNKMVFVVESGFIGFSVLVFSGCCLAALLLLHFRRRWIGAELGGPFVPKIVSALALLALWIGWIAIVCHRVLRYEEMDWTEMGIATIGFLSFEGCIYVSAVILLYRYRRRPRGGDEAREINVPAVESKQAEEKARSTEGDEEGEPRLASHESAKENPMTAG